MVEYIPERWTTSWELKFLQGLGDHRQINLYKERPSRKQLLINYYNLIDKRDKWGYIDPSIIREEVSRMITHETIKETVIIKGAKHGMAKREI